MEELNPDSYRTKNNLYFVIGLQATKHDLFLVNVKEFAPGPSEPKLITADPFSTFAIVLLHYFILKQILIVQIDFHGFVALAVSSQR